MLIQIESIIKDYTSYSLAGRTSFRALNDVSLQVEAGSIFGLLGQNGAGKTTLIKLLMGLAHKKSGLLKIFGAEPGVQTRQRIGYLPENPNFPAHLSGGDILRLYGRLYGMHGSALERKVQESSSLLEIQDALHKNVTAYSKGMKQRLGLAQAILHDPELLILDEPTDGVDPLGRKSIREALMSLRASGKTIFINSHILSEVEMISDRVAILGKGKLLQEGRVTSLLQTEVEYIIQIDALPASLDESIIAKFPGIRLVSGAIECSLKNTSELNNLLSTLIAAGFGILEVNRRKLNLEDVYVKLIEGSGK